MAKKKSKKKSDKKKDIKKKKLLKLKLKKKKAAKKKDTKKKNTKKKPKVTGSSEKLVVEKPASVEKTKPKVQPKVPIIKTADHSSNYNVANAIKKLRSLKTRDALLSFTKGEKRLTITKVIPAAMNRLK